MIASHAATARIEPASLTKIMTAYIVFGALQDGTLKPEQKVRVSTRAWKVPAGSSKMFLEPGSLVTVDNLLRGLMVQSGNDAAVALAEAVSGSVEAFVERMNQTAVALGLHGTHFASPHGLSDPATYSTVSDLSVLATRFIRDYPELYRTYDSAKRFTYNNITQSNRNRLLWLDPSVDGLKTGHTDAAGYCLVATARRPNGADQRRLITVVVGVESEKQRTKRKAASCWNGASRGSIPSLYAKGQPVAMPEVWKGQADSLKAGFARDLYVTVPAGARSNRCGRRASRWSRRSRRRPKSASCASWWTASRRGSFRCWRWNPSNRPDSPAAPGIRSACGGVKPRAEQRRPA